MAQLQGDGYMRKRWPASAGEDCNKMQIYLRKREKFGEFVLLMCGEKKKVEVHVKKPLKSHRPFSNRRCPKGNRRILKDRI